MSTAFETIPGVGAPARRALLAAGHRDLESLDGVPYADLAALHGVGPRALERLQAALTERELALGGQVPAPADRRAEYSDGHTGVNSPDLKTAETEQDPAAWIESLPWPRRVEQGRALLALFTHATGEDPVMWGSSMIGYGQVHYRYATGREGDTFRLGFSPRKASLSLYGLQHHPRSDELLAALGAHTLGAGCVYVKKLEDIDLGVLRELVTHAWESDPAAC